MPSEQPPTRVETAARALDKMIWLTDDVPYEVLEPARELHEALIDEPDGPAPAQPQPRGEKARVADPTPCDRCGNPIGIVWFADNSLFNEITGTVGVGMLCPTCFDHLAAPCLLTWKAAPVGEQELAAPPRGEEARVSARATSTKEDG